MDTNSDLIYSGITGASSDASSKEALKAVEDGQIKRGALEEQADQLDYHRSSANQAALDEGDLPMAMPPPPSLTSGLQPRAYAEGRRAPFRGPAPQNLPQDNRSGSSEATTADLEANSPNDDGLVEAKPVVCSKELSLEEATPVEDKARKHCHTIGPVVVTFLLVSAVVLVTFLVVFLGLSDDEEIEASMEAPLELDIVLASTPEDYLKGILKGDNLQSFNGQFTTNYSAPRLAFEWLAEDPNLKSYPNERIIQRYVLANLYHSTGGDHWVNSDNWLSYDHHECEWYAGSSFMVLGDVATSDYPCNQESGLYERLWLPYSNLAGTLPEDLYSLTSLQSIEMLFNMGLQGTISTRIGQLAYLDKISLVRTSMIGTIPTQLGLLSQMEILYLSKADIPFKFHGRVPSLEKMTRLKQLALDFNNFSGSLPRGIGGMSNLSLMGVQGSNFTGSIPNDWGNLTDLRYMYLHSQELTGTIPSNLGHLSKMSTFHLYNNQLQGSIPSQLGSIANLKEIMLSNNTLSGSVPSELGLLSDASFLFFSHNKNLTGSLPPEMQQLSKLIAFDIAETDVTVTSQPQALEGNFSFERYFFDCDRRYPCDKIGGVHKPAAQMDTQMDSSP